MNRRFQCGKERMRKRFATSPQVYFPTASLRKVLKKISFDSHHRDLGHKNKIHKYLKCHIILNST